MIEHLCNHYTVVHCTLYTVHCTVYNVVFKPNEPNEICIYITPFAWFQVSYYE